MEYLATSGVFLLSIFGQPVHASEISEPIVIPETIEQRIDRVATTHNIATSSLYNLVKCESSFVETADNGDDRGLVQINRTYYPEITDEQAFDPEFALNFAAEKISKGEGYKWTCGNCYSLALNELGRIPKMAELIPNTDYPNVGGLILF